MHPCRYFWHLVGGDFKTTHNALGYTKNTPWGNRLQEHINDAKFTISPTIHSNSVERDTTTDLTLSKGQLSASWYNTHDMLMSNHTLPRTTVDTIPPAKRARKQRAAKRDKVRHERPAAGEHSSLQEWTELRRTILQLPQFLPGFSFRTSTSDLL